MNVIISKTIKQIEKRKLEVIYGDTDSIFIDTELSKEKANKLISKIDTAIKKGTKVVRIVSDIETRKFFNNIVVDKICCYYIEVPKVKK